MKSIRRYRLFTLCLGLLAFAPQSHSQTPSACLPGQLDPNFAADSDFGAGLRVLESNFSNFGVGLLLQPDFKLLGSSIRNNDAATTDSELGRFLSQSRLTDNGNLDLDFNAGGTRNTRFFDGSNVTVEGNTTDRVHDLLQLPNGQFMVLLSTVRGGQSLVLARLNADGTTDFSFGTQGAVHVTRAQLGIPNSGFRDLTLLRQDDGRLLVAIVFSANDEGMILARFNADGSLDSGFAAADADGINGLVMLRQSPAPQAPVIRLQNGRPVVMAFDGNQDYSFYGFTAAGALDASFGTNGRALITTNNVNFNSLASHDFVVQADGRLLFTTSTAALGRLTATGALDTSFAGDGLVLRDGGGAGGSGARGVKELTSDLRNLLAQRLAVQADGKIIVLGSDYIGSGDGQRRFHLARFFADGLPDLGFGDDRIEITPARTGATLPRIETFHRSLLIDPTGRVLFSAHFQGNNGQVAITDGNRQIIGRLCGGESASTRVSDFVLTDRTGVVPNSVQTSNIITIAGLPAGQSALIRVDNGSYSIGCSTADAGTFIESMEKVVNGDTVCVRHTAAASGTMTTTLTLGGGPDEFNEAFITDTALPEPGTIQFDPATVSVSEGASMAVLTVTRTGGTSGAVNASIRATGGTATEGVDFSGSNFNIAFADGEGGRKTATVMILNDGIDEPDETVVFTLSEQVSAPTLAAKALGAQTKATLTIVDDDEAPTPAPAGTLQFAQANLSVSEAAGTATLTVTRTGGTAGAANAVITVSGGSATQVADFSGDRFSIAFADGEGGSKTATVNLVNDSVVEPDETVIYTLSEAVVAGSPPESKAGNGAKALGSPATITLTIVNDDVAPTPTPDPTPTPTPVGTPVQATGNSSGGVFGLALLPVLMGMAALRRKLAAAAFLAALLPAAQASAPGDWAVRLSAGPTYPSSNSASLQQALNARGHAVTAQQDEDRLGYTIDLEYALSADLSLQASYARLGEAKASVGGTTPNEAQLVRDIGQQLPHFGDLLSLSALWHLPLFAGIELEPSLGLFVLHGEREGKTAAVRFKDEHTLAGGLLGMGLSGPTGLSPQLRWASGLRFYGSSDASALLLFGLEYRWTR